jgi:hypothetical protein
MDELEVERHDVLVGLAAALLELVGLEVTASLQAADGSTAVLLFGRLEQGIEIPWRRDEVLVLVVGGGNLLIRASEVAKVDRWSFEVAGRSYASVCVSFRDGTSALIHQDVEGGGSV